MRKLALTVLLLPLLLAGAGCGDQDGNAAEMDFGGEDLGPDRYAVNSRDGDMKLGLTDQHVYFALAEDKLEEVRSDLRAESEEEGVKGSVGKLVKEAAGKALGFRAKLAVDEIEDIRWEDGAMRIQFTDPERSFRNGFQVDGRPATEAFAEEDVRAFAEEFRRLKAERR